jgi:hypothetical protein
VALGMTTECLILPLVPLLMFCWTRKLGSRSQLYYAVTSCIIHHHQSVMIEIEQSPKHHKFIVYWHGWSLKWFSLHSIALEPWNFIQNSPFFGYPIFFLCCLGNIFIHITKC